MKYFLLFIFSISTLFTLAQNVPETLVPDDRLYEVYDRNYVDGLVSENPFLIERWNYYLDNAFYIQDAIDGKPVDYPAVVIPDLENVNILLLEKEQGIQKDWDKLNIYKIRDTNKILVYYAGKDFTESLKQHLEEKPKD